MRYKDLFEAITLKKPIGWWLDSDPCTFYHGTHISRKESIEQNGIYAPKDGPTARWVSLALEPQTAKGYASMTGGESAFRKAGNAARHVPMNERIVAILSIPQNYFLPKMAPARGNMDNERSKLLDKERYLKEKKEWINRVQKRTGKTEDQITSLLYKFDQEYYAITEIRLPDLVPSNFIIDWMTN